MWVGVIGDRFMIAGFPCISFSVSGGLFGVYRCWFSVNGISLEMSASADCLMSLLLCVCMFFSAMIIVVSRSLYCRGVIG